VRGEFPESASPARTFAALVALTGCDFIMTLPGARRCNECQWVQGKKTENERRRERNKNKGGEAVGKTNLL